MDDEDTRQYRRDQASTNPFGRPPHLHQNQGAKQGEPGSRWGLPQIEWLGIRFSWNCDATHMLSPDSQFQADSQLQRSIINALSMPWEEIINGNDLDHTSLYAALARLAQILKPLEEYDRSSTIEGSSQRQGPSTPIQHIRSSPPQMPASLTPRPNRRSPLTLQGQAPRSPFSSPLSSPPALINTPTESSQHQASKSTLASSPTPHSKGRPDFKEVVNDEYDSGDEDAQGGPDPWADSFVPRLPSRYGLEDALGEDAQGKGKRTLHSALKSYSATDRWSNLRGRRNPTTDVPEHHSSDVDQPELKSRSPPEDLDYHPSFSQTALDTSLSEFPNISKAQLQAEHKSEEDVQHAARIFLEQLMNFFHDRCMDNHNGLLRQWDLTLMTR